MPVHPEDIERVLMPGRLRSIGRAGNINNNIIISSAEYQANQRVLHFLLRGFPPASSPIPDLPPVIIAVRPANAIPSPPLSGFMICVFHPNEKRHPLAHMTASNTGFSSIADFFVLPALTPFRRSPPQYQKISVFFIKTV